ncbi:hypothetical protein V5O48_011254 [Marasmius crinis-equi]|uniref:Uncharacterized protein n=1 Tax=Marasmius crinis-equi TaxID=585013 RepID=A0ABR3F6I6_9AGAR
MHIPSQKCMDSNPTPIGKLELLMDFSLLRSLLTIVFETSSALLITIRTVRSFRAYGAPWQSGRKNVIYLIFEEGLVYFGLISIFTVATFILKLRAPPGPFQDILNAFTLPLSGILTARFILDLKAWSSRDQDEDSEITTLRPRTSQEPESPTQLTWQDTSQRHPFLFSHMTEFGEDPEVTAKRQKRAFDAGRHDVDELEYWPDSRPQVTPRDAELLGR